MIRQYPLDTWKLIEHQQQELMRDAEKQRLLRLCEESRPGVVARMRAAVERALAAVGLVDQPGQRTGSPAPSETQVTSAYELLCGSCDDDDPWRWVFGRHIHGYPSTLGI
jgi:hypothetical protein